MTLQDNLAVCAKCHAQYASLTIRRLDIKQAKR